jgi:hypothetical protein
VGNLPFSGSLEERLKVLNTSKIKNESGNNSRNKKQVGNSQNSSHPVEA